MRATWPNLHVWYGALSVNRLIGIERVEFPAASEICSRVFVFKSVEASTGCLAPSKIERVSTLAHALLMSRL